MSNLYYTYVDKGNHTYISANFKNGNGRIYVSIVNFDDTSTEYPSDSKFDITSTYAYLGQGLSVLTSLMHQKCISTLCKLLISVYGKYSWSDDGLIQYKLSISAKDKTIYENKPYRNWVAQGEVQFFSVFIHDPVKIISTSVTNLDGHANLIMNYGKENYPTTFNSTWWSNTIQSEFIDIDINDNFFDKNNLLSMQGWYTIGVYGVTNTSFTLQVSTHPNQVIHLDDSSPASCRRIRDKGQQYCFFRYMDFEIPEKATTFDMVISTEYLYGTGIIYAKLAVLEDFKNYDYFESLPTISNFEFTSKDKFRNQLYLSSK